MPETKELVYILFGWLLGIIGPGLIDRIRSKYRKGSVGNCLLVELAELKFRLAGTAYLAKDHRGTLDKPFIEWLHQIVKDYKGVYEKPERVGQYEEYLKLTDAQIKTASKLSSAKGGIGISIKKYSLPFIENNVSMLTLFNSSSLGMILELQSQLSFFNQEIDNMRFYDQMMFNPGITPENHGILKTNFSNSLEGVGKSCIRMVELIVKTETSLRKSYFCLSKS